MTRLMETVPSTVFESSLKELIIEIEQMIHTTTNLGVQEMCVTLEDGKVVLSGHCRTFYTKKLAQHAAMKVLGTDELVNDIRVA